MAARKIKHETSVQDNKCIRVKGVVLFETVNREFF